MVTNPDMLHLSILPCHGEFVALLSNLKYVVIDEVSCLELQCQTLCIDVHL